MKKIQTPTWFTESLNLAERFSEEIRIPAGRAEEWLKTLYDSWNSPEERPLLLSAWKKLSQEEKRIESRLRLREWKDLDSDQLVAILYNFIAVKMAQENFLPTHSDDPVIRTFLVSNVLLFNALSQLETDTRDNFGVSQFARMNVLDRALMPVLKWSWYNMAGPFAASEIKRRGSGHVGYGFALLLLQMRPDRKTNAPASMFLHSDPDKLLRTLTKAVFGATFRHKKTGRKMSVPRRWRKGKKEAERDLPGDIAEHINSAIRMSDPAEALAQSLNGVLNIVPKAIGNEITKKARPKKRVFALVFDDAAVSEAPDSGWQLEDWVRARELDERLKEHEFSHRYLKLDMPANTTKKKRAKALSITDRQLRRDEQKVREILKK